MSEDENKDKDIKVKNGLELLNDKEKQMVEDYIKTIPVPINSEDVLDAEKEYAVMQIKREKLLNYIKQKVLTKDDYQEIGGKKFIKKSGVRRLMSAFNISISSVKILNIIERDWDTAPEDYVKQIGKKKEIIVIAQATAQKKVTISKNGQTYSIVTQEMVATAGYSSREAYEKHQPYKFHNIIATAETRAKSRCALDMLSGDVSFEEITFDEEVEDSPTITTNTKHNYQEG